MSRFDAPLDADIVRVAQRPDVFRTEIVTLRCHPFRTATFDTVACKKAVF